MALLGTGRDDRRRAGDSSGPSPQIAREGGTYLTDLQAEKFCELFADGLESGLGYGRIFDMVERSDVPSETADRLRDAVLERGDLLGEAFARFGILDERARKLVLVSQKQGRLPPTFRQLARVYGDRYRRKKETVLALAEPMIWVALGIVLLNLFGSDLTEIVLSRDTYGRVADIARTAAVQIGLYGGGTAVAIFGWLHLPVDSGLRDLGTRIWMRIPIAGRPFRLRSIATFCRSMHRSLSTGLNIFESLELAADASNNGQLIDEIDRARDKLEEGETLAEALSGASTLPDQAIEYIDVAEESGRLQQRFEKLGDDYTERAQRRGRQYLQAATWLVRLAVIVTLIATLFSQILEMSSQL